MRLVISDHTDLDLMREEISPLGDGRVIHTYSLTSQGRALCEELIKSKVREWERVRELAERVKWFTDEELIKTTKVCWVLKVILEEVEERARPYVWKITGEEVKEALENLERMGIRWWV